MADENEADFGAYLVSVGERDIDLLLMEEFQISENFIDWFARQLGLSAAVPAGAWHSVSDADGETDLLLRVRCGDRRIGILIENKIAAPEQDKQAERYHIRGTRAREAGKVDQFLTVMCAPQCYLDAMAPDSAYQHRVSYEAISDWFARQEGRRAAWRQRIFVEAIAQGRRGYTMVVNSTNTAFFRDYWEHLQRKHPRIYMARPTNKGSKSNWIIMRGHDFPKGVHLHHKIDQKVMELGFNRQKIEHILAAQSDWPEDMIVVQKQGTAALMINVPAVDMTISVASQLDAIEEALRAAYRLMPYANLLSR